MAKCKIEGGICGFVTTVEAHPAGKRNIRLKITSDCPNVSKLTEEFVQRCRVNEQKEGVEIQPIIVIDFIGVKLFYNVKIFVKIIILVGNNSCFT